MALVTDEDTATNHDSDTFHSNDAEIQRLNKDLRKEQSAPHGGDSDRAKDLKRQIAKLRTKRTKDLKKNASDEE